MPWKIQQILTKHVQLCSYNDNATVHCLWVIFVVIYWNEKPCKRKKMTSPSTPPKWFMLFEQSPHCRLCCMSFRWGIPWALVLTKWQTNFLASAVNFCWLTSTVTQAFQRIYDGDIVHGSLSLTLRQNRRVKLNGGVLIKKLSSSTSLTQTLRAASQTWPCRALLKRLSNVRLLNRTKCTHAVLRKVHWIELEHRSMPSSGSSGISQLSATVTLCVCVCGLTFPYACARLSKLQSMPWRMVIKRPPLWNARLL